MRRNWKRGAAALLTASMLFSNISMTGLAEEEVSTQADEAAVQAEEAPETAAQTEAPAPATEAPTEAPAPVTEAPTEAPAPATEAPTEAPTPETAAQTEAPAPATEAQTETKTEKQTQGSETQSESEKKTEKESEKGIYTVEEKNYTVMIEMPDDCKIPEGAELVADIVKKDTKEAKEDLKLAKETAGKDTEITGYQIYDLHFEKDNKEVELTPREKADIKVTLTIDKKEFRKDLDEKDLEVFHIRDLTEEELKKKEESEAASQEQSEKETESEKKSDEPTQTAEKLKIKKAEEKDGKEIITFSTDGFSDYLFAVTKEKETEKETEKQTEKQTESETKKAAETEPQTNAPIAAHDGETQTKQQADLTLTVQSVGTKTEAKDLVITAKNVKDLQTAVRALGTENPIKVMQGTADITAEIKINEDKITIPAKYVEDGKSLKIAGLPVKGDDATAEAEYSVNMSGNYINAGKLTVSSDYYTIYKDTINNKLASTNGSYTFKLTGDLGLSIENVYSAVTFIASGTDKPDSKFTGMKYDIIPEGAATPAYTVTSDNNGEAVLKGLPGGRYTVNGDTSTIPLTYWSESKSQNITISDGKATADVELKTYKPITVTLKSTDSRTGKGIAKAKFTVKKTDGTGKSTTVTADSNGQATLAGVLERGAKYTITQSRVSGHYSATSKNLSSSTYTVNKDGEDPVIAFSNQPTVLKVGVIDNVSKTSPYSGSYIKGATVEILKVNKDKTTTLVKTITTEGQLTEIIGVLDPGTYQVKQTAAPAGYIVGARTEKGTQSVGKQISLSSSTKQEKTVAISADTVKVLVTRKGYDSRTQVTKNGKKAYEYTNLKVLSGATMEIRDKDGNVVKDQNGNPVSWTSSSQGGHLVEGVLAANTEYTLVETGAPSGYDQAGSGKFHTYKSGNQAAVTMQTRRASGSIRVVMRAAYKGDAIKVNGTYYCALFTDKNLTKRYVAAGVRRLTMTTSQVYAEATFENIPAGVYYVAETDKNGNPLKDNATFKVNNPEEGLHMDTSKDLIAEITNDYVTEPAGAQKVSSSELKRSYNSEYAGYGGSASAAAQLAAGGNAVQTGDTTNFMLYVSMLAAACVLFAAVIIMRKRREK